VLRGSWCRRHSLLLQQLGGYGILPLVCTFFRRHVDYGTSHLRSPIFGSYFIYGTQLSFVSILHPRRHVVNSAFLRFRELRVLQLCVLHPPRPVAATSCRLHSSLLPRPPRHSVAFQFRVMSSRPSVAPRRAAVQSPQFNRRSPTSPMFNCRGPASQTFDLAGVQPRHCAVVPVISHSYKQ